MGLPPGALSASLLGLELENEGFRRIIFPGRKLEVRARHFQRRQRSEMLRLKLSDPPPGPEPA
jgi:hypothetical protein